METIHKVYKYLEQKVLVKPRTREDHHIIYYSTLSDKMQLQLSRTLFLVLLFCANEDEAKPDHSIHNLAEMLVGVYTMSGMYKKPPPGFSFIISDVDRSQVTEGSGTIWLLLEHYLFVKFLVRANLVNLVSYEDSVEVNTLSLTRYWFQDAVNPMTRKSLMDLKPDYIKGIKYCTMLRYNGKKKLFTTKEVICKNSSASLTYNIYNITKLSISCNYIRVQSDKMSYTLKKVKSFYDLLPAKWKAPVPICQNAAPEQTGEMTAMRRWKNKKTFKIP
nr:hypothetical protein BgiMline_027812 [Biomphalaria glabrata]